MGFSFSFSTTHTYYTKNMDESKTSLATKPTGPKAHWIWQYIDEEDAQYICMLQKEDGTICGHRFKRTSVQVNGTVIKHAKSRHSKLKCSNPTTDPVKSLFDSIVNEVDESIKNHEDGPSPKKQKITSLATKPVGSKAHWICESIEEDGAEYVCKAAKQDGSTCGHRFNRTSTQVNGTVIKHAKSHHQIMGMASLLLDSITNDNDLNLFLKEQETSPLKTDSKTDLDLRGRDSLGVYVLCICGRKTSPTLYEGKEEKPRFCAYCGMKFYEPDVC